MKTKKLISTLLLFGSVMTASATDYYVSPKGAGNKDGSSLDHAWDIGKLQEKCTNGNTNFQNGDKIYFAGGTYVPTATLYFNMGVELLGAEGAQRTVFSGDTDNDAYRDRLFNINTAIADDLIADTPNTKPVTVKNIDFTLLTMNQPYDVNASGAAPVGALYIQNCGSTVTVDGCNFYDIVNTGHGGSAICSKFSRIVVSNCAFKNIKALARGVAIRLHSNSNVKGYTTLKNCVFENNEATTTTATDPCGVVMLQYGQELNVTSCVFRNNNAVGKSGAIFNGTAPDATYKRAMTVENSLFYNNTFAGGSANILGNTATTLTNNVIHDDATSASINISGVEVGTYYLSLPFIMPEGVTGKTISAAADGALTYGETYNAGDKVPAGTALLVSGAQGQHEPVLATVAASAPTNLLKGSDVATETEGGDKYYKLANDSEKGIGFYWGTANGAAFQNGAHKAYLALSDTQAAKINFFSLDGEATGINNIATGVARQGKYVENGTIVIVRNGIKYNVQGIKL